MIKIPRQDLHNYHVHLTVTEGFILGLFFIQAPQEWMKANTKAFLNYAMIRRRILFWLSSPDVFLEPSSSVLISRHAGVNFEDENTYH